MLIAELDPGDIIDEIHEEWDAKIPGGNNTGYTLITIQAASADIKAPKKFTAKGAKQKETASASMFAADDEPYNYYDANAIYDYAKKESGDTEITLMATAEGDFSYTNALFEVVQYSTQYDDDGTSYDVAIVIDSDSYALTPGDHIYDTTFILTEEDLISGDKIFLEITTEDNFFSIPLSGGTYNGSSPDNNDNNGGGNNNNNNQNNTDNQNNNNTDNPNNGGNSSDQTPNNNNTTPKFVSRTFSKRYTLTRSQPVLWRIGTLTASISGSFLTAENAEGLLAVEIEPTTAGTIPTDKITITATTKSGVTKEGVYSIPVEVSEDGETWYNADNLRFDTSETTSDSESTTTNRISSSGGGCASISASGLAIVLLAGMMIRRKTR